jgi:hypothetical protein
MAAATVLDFAQRDARTFPEVADRLIADAMQLPESERAAAIDRALRAIDPTLAGGVLYETRYLVEQGTDPQHALRLALIALLVSWRKKQYRMLVDEIVPLQAAKITAGVYAGPGALEERAARVRRYIEAVAANIPKRLDRAFARQRLKELGFTEPEAERALTRRPTTARQFAAQLAARLRRRIEPREAVRLTLIDAMREFTLYNFMSSSAWQAGAVAWKQPEAADGQDDELGCICLAIIGAIATIAGTAAGIAIPLAQAEHARRNARRAQNRQKAAPLSQGEVEQLVGAVIQGGATAWGPQQRQSALDYIRVNRFGRTTFVEPEEHALQAAFSTARAAIVARQQAIQQAQTRKQLLIGGAVVATVLAGAIIYKTRT